MAIEAGQIAPDFTLNDQDNNPVTLSELQGKKVLLYFYPRGSTPGCTVQAAYFGDCDRLFRDNPITSVSHL